MESDFVERVRKDIHMRMMSDAHLRQEAERLWRAGDPESYWDLIAPDNTGDLLYLIGQPDAAMKEWERSVQTLRAYRSWAVSRRRPIAPTIFEAGYYLRLGRLDIARRQYQQVAQLEDQSGQEMLALALINTGAVEEGRSYLHRRIARLDQGVENSPTRWYHLAECWFWVGERQQAARYIVQAVQHWPGGEGGAPIQGLRCLISFAITHSSAAKAEATQWLEIAIESFYQEDDIEHAMDAKEYITLLAALTAANDFPAGLKLLGMSFAR